MALADSAGGAGLLPVHYRLPAPRFSGRVCLTIDDGPSPGTIDVLRVLRRHAATACFFVIGSRVEQAPELVRRIVEDGHEVYGHSWTHRRFDRLSDRERAEELERTAAVLQPVAGHASCPVVRLPCGAGVEDRGVHAAIGRWNAASELVQWNVDSRDWELSPGCRTAGDVERCARLAADAVLADDGLEGGIVLLHDSLAETQSALVCAFAPALLDIVLTDLGSARGLAPVSLRHALAIDDA